MPGEFRELNHILGMWLCKGVRAHYYQLLCIYWGNADTSWTIMKNILLLMSNCFLSICLLIFFINNHFL